MGLNCKRVLGLAEDLEKLIIRQKEETCKGQPLGFQVVRQTLQHKQVGQFG